MAIACIGQLPQSSDAFTFISSKSSSSTVARTSSLSMGLLDDAFSKPMSDIDSERETPIDRWMGWSTKKGATPATPQQVPANFVDSMDATNYISIELEKPMGIVFEENDESKFGGIYVVSMSEGGNAEKAGVLQTGDQLVAVGMTNVAGQSFDDALGAIVESDAPKTKLVLFRGSAKDVYGPTGASKDWLQEFIDSGAAQA
eukprot:CAMPEP_0198291154 /NCGR_PEP_ID=MMETSP1449-20131203/8781_1 /TAXON_ID=420275 /ORGANISM="Attheya septentrionalis, Strain CCMP2084" /LENGTH=200 /DNA_ID=CAMNT_0043989759 /DNA_START=99 /DNA_END=701 /DNA_ORIENTATION=-